MAYEQFSNGESLSSIRSKINAGILEVEQAAANALNRANHTGTQAQSTITGLETALQNLNTAVQEAQTSLSAIESLIGEEDGDADSVLNTLREALVILQNFAEGADVAQMITDAQTAAATADQKAEDAQADATEALSLIVPEETSISSDTISINLNRARKTTTAYTPTGNATLSIQSASQVDGAYYQFALVLDGVKSVNFSGSGYKLFNITDGEVLEAGTHDVQCWRMRGVTYINFPDNAKVLSITDEIGPTPVITSEESSPTNADSITVNVDFDEAVFNFTVADVTVTNASISAFSGSGASYSFVLTFEGQGEATVNIASGVCQDVNGNLNIAASEFSITYSAGPVFVSASTNEQGDELSVTFDKVVTSDGTGFTISGTSASVSSLSSGSGTNTLVFSLSEAVLPSDIILLSYDDAVGNVTDGSSNPLESFSNQSVTNNVNAPFTTFNKTSNYVTLGDQLDSIIEPIDAQFAMEAEVEDIQDGSILWAKDGASGALRTFYLYYTANELRCALWGANGDTVTFTVKVPFTPSPATVYLIRMEYDGANDTSRANRVNIYVNGIAGTKTTTEAGGFPFNLNNNDTPFTIGARKSNAGTPSLYFGGKMRNFRAYSGAEFDALEASILNLSTGVDTSGNDRNGTFI